MHRWFYGLLGGLVLATATWANAAGMDRDPEARALQQQLSALPVTRTVLQDDFNKAAQRRLTGPVTMGPGINAAKDPTDKAASFPAGRSPAVYIYYGVVLPQRARLSLDFRLDKLPPDYHFMTICSAGTAGNTKFTIRLGMDRRVSVHDLTRREQISLLSDPVALGQWHHLEWWYAPEGALLIIDGVIEDYSTDYCVPYTVGVGEAFYLGDQPWWNAAGHKGVFYPLDSFVGLIDNLQMVALK